MNTFNRIVLSLLFISCSLQLKAEIKEPQQQILTPWYVGVKGGIPFGVSTFSSFVTDNARLGYNFGALVGYQYNSIFSFEFSAMFGKMELGVTNGDANNWLGADGLNYLAPVVGAQGHYYRDLYSSVAIQQYGLHLNVDLLPIFDCNTNRRFSVLVSPAIYGVETRSTIKTSADERQFIENKRQFNFGVGGDVTVGYRLTDNLAVRLSSGINYVVGRNFDGVPAGDNNNFIWNNDISFTWRFGNKTRKTTAFTSTALIPVQHKEPATIPTEKIERGVFSEKIDVVADVKEGKQISFPSIYFAFNSVEVSSNQMSAIDQIVQLMNDNPEVAVIIRGFTDKYGSEEINKRYARRRSETVQSLLVRRGVDLSRIKTIGVGVDTKVKITREARRVDISADIKTRPVVDKSMVVDLATQTKIQTSDESIVDLLTKDATPIAYKPNVLDEMSTQTKTLTADKSITFPSVYFAFNRVDISPVHMDAVDEIVRLMSENPEVTVDITGFTTKVGAVDINNRFSIKTRAKNLQNILIKRGIDRSRIKTIDSAVDLNAKTEKEARRLDVTITTNITDGIVGNQIEKKPTFFPSILEGRSERVYPRQMSTL